MSRVSGAASGPASFLDVLVTTLEAGRATLWELDRAREEWRTVTERTAAGRPAPTGRKTGSTGHPFTWALRETLVVQVPAERTPAAGAADGWILVGPVPGVDRVLALWFPTSPGPVAREALPSIQAHLNWLSERETSEAPPPERGEPEAGRGV